MGEPSRLSFDSHNGGGRMRYRLLGHEPRLDLGSRLFLTVTANGGERASQDVDILEAEHNGVQARGQLALMRFGGSLALGMSHRHTFAGGRLRLEYGAALRHQIEAGYVAWGGARRGTGRILSLIQHLGAETDVSLRLRLLRTNHTEASLLLSASVAVTEPVSSSWLRLSGASVTPLEEASHSAAPQLSSNIGLQFNLSF